MSFTNFVDGIEYLDGVEWEKIAQGYKHVDSVIHQAEDYRWYGYSVREAFIAGAEWQEKRDESKLYYEAHITIEPVFDEAREYVRVVAEANKFKLADLLMKKRSEDTEERSSKDTFMTGHSKSLLDIETRTRDTIRELQEAGFKVWRYKIEDTILDSRTKDVFNLLGEQSDKT